MRLRAPKGLSRIWLALVLTVSFPLEATGKLEELLQAVRRDCDLVFIVGLIPPGQVRARIERFEVRGLLGHPC